jgi:hypothetical protein
MTGSVKDANPIGAYDPSSVKQKHETVNNNTPKPTTPLNAPSVPPMPYTIDDEWFYVDPKGTQQGELAAACLPYVNTRNQVRSGVSKCRHGVAPAILPKNYNYVEVTRQ